MITDALAVEQSSNCLKEETVSQQKDAVSVVVRLKESYPYPRFSSKEAAFIAQTTASTDVKTII